MVHACRYCSESCEAEVVQGTSLMEHITDSSFTVDNVVALSLESLLTDRDIVFTVRDEHETPSRTLNYVTFLF